MPPVGNRITARAAASAVDGAGPLARIVHSIVAASCDDEAVPRQPADLWVGSVGYEKYKDNRDFATRLFSAGYRDLYEAGRIDEGRERYMHHLLTQHRDALSDLMPLLRDKRTAVMASNTMPRVATVR